MIESNLPLAGRPRWSNPVVLSIAIIGFVAFGILWMMARPAEATAGFHRVESISPLNSAEKGAVVTCPAGRQVYGTGVRIDHGGGQVIVSTVSPDFYLRSVTAYAKEDQDGYSGSWTITVQAICGP